MYVLDHKGREQMGFGTMTLVAGQRFLISWNPTWKHKRKPYSRDQKAIDTTVVGTSYHHKPQNTSGKGKSPELHSLVDIRK